MSSENDEYVDRHDDAPSPLASVLTPGASAIAGFAFAVFSMLGQGTWTQAVQSLFWGTSFPPDQVAKVFIGWAFASLVIAALAIVLARRALADPVAARSWEGNLARGAIIISAAAVLLSAIGILGGILHL
jgi:hypothetical protein